MATVYHGLDPRFKREVALKVLPPEFLHDPTFRARFEREAQTIAALDHPAIVPVYDFGEQEGQLFLVMRYLPGGSLTERMENGQISLDEIVYIVERLAPALDEAHKIGIIHRDLKPDNILFDQRNDPFITDFGIAKLSEGGSALTRDNLIVGTPAYMSPEQASGDIELDGRSDIYSFGIILFEMLTGQQPFEANTAIGVLMKHMSEPIPDILEMNPELPEDCQVVIEKALAKERDERYQTTVELAEALALAVRGESPQKSRTISRITPTSTPKPAIRKLKKKKDTLELQREPTVACPQCYKPNPKDATQCAYCGANLKRYQFQQQTFKDARQRALAEREQALREKRARQLREKLEKVFDDLNSWTRSGNAARHLVRLLNRETFDILIEDMFQDRETEARLHSAQLLDRLCERSETDDELVRQASEAFLEALEDPEPEIQQQARETLEKIEKRESGPLKGLLGWFKGD